MIADWLSRGLHEIARALAPRPADSVRIEPPSGFDHELDLTSEAVSIAKEHAPSAVMGYRADARRGDPRNLIALYREMPGRAAGAPIRRAKVAIESAEWEFAPRPLAARDETIQSPEARVGREVAEYLRTELGPHMPTALAAYARKELYGFSALKFAVEAGGSPGGLERVTVFEELLGDRFRLDPRSFEWLFYQKARGGSAVPCAPFRATGSLLLFEDGTGLLPLDQRGLLWQIVIPWCVYIYGLRWWSRLNERFALPYVDVSYAANVKNGADEAEKIARKLGSSGAAVRPKDAIEVQFLNSMQAAQPDSLERAQEFCLRAFAAALLGHDQATGAREGAGAKTSDVAAQGVAKWHVAQQLRKASSDLMAQWAGPMVLRNFGPKVAAMHTPVLVLRQAQEVDREAEARIAALAVSAGAEIPQVEFLKRIGYREPRPGEKVLSRRQPSGTPGAAVEPEKLGANVVRFPQLSAAGAAPVLGADGAPAGIAEELLAPYRRIFTDALKDGATPVQALSRVTQRARTRPEAKLLADRLSSVLFASTGNGLESVRDERSGS